MFATSEIKHTWYTMASSIVNGLARVISPESSSMMNNSTARPSPTMSYFTGHCRRENTIQYNTAPRLGHLPLCHTSQDTGGERIQYNTRQLHGSAISHNVILHRTLQEREYNTIQYSSIARPSPTMSYLTGHCRRENTIQYNTAP